MTNRIIAPSLLAADYARLGDAVCQMEAAGADWLHYDVMDASFVPTLSFGAGVLKAIRPLTSLPMDVHVMAVHPYKLIDDLMDAGADGITYHIETVEDGPALIERIRARGLPGWRYAEPCHTGATAAAGSGSVDMVLVMTVNPGYGGQKMIPECLDKVRWILEPLP